jgi:hypothetical protein
MPDYGVIKEDEDHASYGESEDRCAEVFSIGH